jgi:hypothetical protein
MGAGRKWLILAGALMVGIQLVPTGRSNPPEPAPLVAGQPVLEVFQRACFDCHSNRTAWPWYSRVAPVSWLVVGHVKEGREHLNFSEWENLTADRRAKLAGDAYGEAAAGKMPLQGYTLLHGEARLTGADLNLIKAWSRSR